jgi:3-(3-hydroxy-phenyl)propionate hydroxylase
MTEHAAVIAGGGPAGLRSARVLRTNMAQTPLTRSDARLDALRDSVAEMLGLDEPRRRFGAMMSGLDICYDPGRGAPADRAPHARPRPGGLRYAGAGLQPAARGQAGAAQPGRFRPSPGNERVRLIAAAYPGPRELPVLGEVPAPAAVLIRPDGYVAWAGDPAEPRLPDALTTWFGAPG